MAQPSLEVPEYDGTFHRLRRYRIPLVLVGVLIVFVAVLVGASQLDQKRTCPCGPPLSYIVVFHPGTPLSTEHEVLDRCTQNPGVTSVRHDIGNRFVMVTTEYLHQNSGVASCLKNSPSFSFVALPD